MREWLIYVPIRKIQLCCWNLDFKWRSRFSYKVAGNAVGAYSVVTAQKACSTEMVNIKHATYLSPHKISNAHAAVAYMVDSQPSALGTGCHPGCETSVGLQGQQKLYVRRTCDLNHILMSCTHFGERPSVEDIAEMKDGYVQWLRAIADTA